MRFDKGPEVHLHVEMKNGSLLSSYLTLSDSFSCSGANSFLLEWLSKYIEGKADPLDFSTEFTAFQKNTMQAMQKIPFGKTTTYQKLASLIGSPKAARAVGNACNKNPFPLFVPCHRVIQSNGEIGGFAFDLRIKRKILEFESNQLSVLL